MSKVTYEQHLQALKDDGHTIIAASCSTGGTASITLIQNGQLKNDTCEIVTCVKECECHTVVMNILVEEEYGWGSIPVNSEMFGKRLGSVDILSVIKHLPTAYTDKATALKYLSKNPSNLVELLSQTLNMQKNIIEHQSNKIGNLDWNLSCIYEEGTSKIRRFMDLIFGKDVKDGWLPNLKSSKDKLMNKKEA